jgi:hypothetical protein
VPLKYNVLARNYYSMMNLGNKEGQKGLNDATILENMRKIKEDLELNDLKIILDEIMEEGFLEKIIHGNYFRYTLNSELTLSEKAMVVYRQTIEPSVKWPILFWDDYFNIRELNFRVERYENLN